MNGLQNIGDVTGPVGGSLSLRKPRAYRPAIRPKMAKAQNLGSIQFSRRTALGFLLF